MFILFCMYLNNIDVLLQKKILKHYIQPLFDNNRTEFENQELFNVILNNMDEINKMWKEHTISKYYNVFYLYI